MITDRAISPVAQPLLEEVAPAISRIDGRNAFGQLTGLAAARDGIDKAKRHGLAITAVRNGSHLGRLGEWAELTTASQLVFMAFANTSGGARNVATFGGHERKLSTNPIASLAGYLRGPQGRLPDEGTYNEQLRSERDGINIPNHVLRSVSQLGSALSIEMSDYVPGLWTGSEHGDESQKTW